jgi:O-antigen/teichoic acid export membrane protein
VTDDPRPGGAPAPADSTDRLSSSSAGPAAIRGGALRVVTYLVGVVLTVGSAAALFRHLGVDDGGRYVVVISLVAIVGGMTDAGLTAIGVRELAVAEPGAQRRLMGQLVGIRVVLTSLAVVGAVAFAAVAGYPSLLVLGTVVAGAGLLVQNVQQTASIPLQVELRFGWVSVADLLRQAVTAGAILLLVVAGAGLLPFYAVPILAGLAALAVTVALTRGRFRLLPTYDRTAWRSLLRDTLPFALATAIGALYLRVALIVVSLVCTAEQTGYYGVSFRVVDVLVVVPQLVVGAAFPIFARAARDDHARLAYASQRMFEACALLGAGCAVALAGGAGVVIDVVGGSSFGPAADVLRVQGVALALAFVSALTSYLMLSLGMYRQLLLTSLTGFAANVGLVTLLATTHEAIGAAAATVASEAVLVGTGLVLLARTHAGVRPTFGRIPRIVAAAGLACLALLLPLPGLAVMAVASLAFVVLTLLLRAVPEELLVEVRRRWRPAAAG